MANQAQFVKIVHLNHLVQVDNFNKLSLIGHFSVFVKF